MLSNNLKVKKIVSLFVFISLITIPLLFITTSGISQTIDSPWPTYKGDIKNTGLSKYSTKGITNRVQWNFKTGGFIVSSPVIGPNGTVYVGSGDGSLYAIKQNGILKWSFQTGDEVRTSPSISNKGVIYFGSRDGFFYALNQNGSVKWSYKTDGKIDSSPLLDEKGAIYFGSEDGYLYSLDRNGTLRWRFPTNDGIVTSPALMDDGNIIIGSKDGNIYSISKDGQLTWSFETDGQIRSSPSVDDENNIYFGSTDNKLYSLYKNGSERWNYKTDSWIGSSPSIGPEDDIYFGSTDKNFYALSNNGNLKWKYLSYGFWRSSPTISLDGTIFIGDTDGTMYAFGLDGKLKWEKYLQQPFYSSAAINDHKTIYVGSVNGNIYAIGLNEEGKTPSSPINFNLQKEDDHIVLKWDSPEDKGISEIIGYNIYRGKSKENMVLIDSTSYKIYNDTEVNLDETYFYHITAINEKGESIPTDIKEITFTSNSDERYTFLGLDRNFFIILSLVTIIIITTGIFLTIKRNKEYSPLHNSDDHLSSGELNENQGYNNIFTCPHCGYQTKLNDENKRNIKCPRCKSNI